MLRQTTQQLITALYPRLSHEDELQGESNSISCIRATPVLRRTCPILAVNRFRKEHSDEPG